MLASSHVSFTQPIHLSRFMWRCMIFKCDFLRKAHSTEQNPSQGCPRLVLTAKSTEAMHTKCLAQGHNILMLLGYKQSISVSRHQHHDQCANI